MKRAVTKRACGVRDHSEKCDLPKGHHGDHKDRSYPSVHVSWPRKGTK